MYGVGELQVVEGSTEKIKKNTAESYESRIDQMEDQITVKISMHKGHR